MSGRAGRRVGPGLVTAVVVAGLGGCGSGEDTPVTALPGASAGTASLRIAWDDGAGTTTTWTLTCDPPGGSHPDPVTACGVLEAHAAAALAEVPPDTACTEQFGGPQHATVTGTWRGAPVAAELTLVNGCEIARWTALRGLLPPGGAN